MEELEMKISQLVDNELSDTEQIEVFGVLANDEKARQQYSKLLMLKKEVSKHHSEVRTDLFPIKLVQPVQELPKVNIYKFGFTFSSVAAIILIMFLLWGQNENKRTVEQFNSLLEKYELIKAEKKQLLNKHEVKTTVLNAAFTKKRKIKKAVLTEAPISVNTTNITTNTDRLRKFTQIPLANNVVINKDDFIGGQIVSN
ncbi:MAG: hypothetical protein WCZ90_17190 [Melioribacteraceae bacterium]